MLGQFFRGNRLGQRDHSHPPRRFRKPFEDRPEVIASSKYEESDSTKTSSAERGSEAPGNEREDHGFAFERDRFNIAKKRSR
jgi:hypothetical protein